MPLRNTDSRPHERRSAYRVKIPALDLVTLSVDTGLGYPVDYTVTDLSENGASIMVSKLLADAHPLQADVRYQSAKLYWRSALELELDFSRVAERQKSFHLHYGIAFADCSPLTRRRLVTLALKFQKRNQEMAKLFGKVIDFSSPPPQSQGS